MRIMPQNACIKALAADGWRPVDPSVAMYSQEYWVKIVDGRKYCAMLIYWCIGRPYAHVIIRRHVAPDPDPNPYLTTALVESSENEAIHLYECSSSADVVRRLMDGLHHWHDDNPFHDSPEKWVEEDRMIADEKKAKREARLRRKNRQA